MHIPHHSPAEDGEKSAGTPLHRLLQGLPDEAATIALGHQLAPLLRAGMVIWLDGDLGAGKTTLVRAMLRALAYDGPVKSPTYTLVEVYVVSSIYWYHFDFYRFSDPEEFEDAGLGEYFRCDSICLVEWPGNAGAYVPPADLVLRFRFAENASDDGRCLELTAHSDVGQQCLNALHLSTQNDVV